MMGKRNFDYVTMGDYSNDLAEASAHARGIIEQQQRQIEKWMTLAYLMLQKHGPFEVGVFALMDGVKNGEIIESYTLAGLDKVYAARLKSE